MNETPQPANGPAAFDVVEIVDRLSGSHVSAKVDSASEYSFVLRLGREARIPQEAHLRWFDGATAWQAIAELQRIDDARVSCELAPAGEWERTPARRSVRAPVANSPLMVRVTESTVLARGRRMHTVCVDISASGCRVNWAGTKPRAGDIVDVAWEAELPYGSSAEWVPARVARIIPRPFGAHHVCFSFELGDPRHAALVRAWHAAWLQSNRLRPRDDRAA
jgi:hypothetical protein